MTLPPIEVHVHGYEMTYEALQITYTTAKTYINSEIYYEILFAFKLIKT